MRISDQDIRALRYLHEVKVATYRQIHRDIYPDKSLKTAYNRIAHLAKQNLVSGIYDRLGLPSDKVFSLSKRGFNRFVANGTEKRIELRSDAVLHDLSLVDLRFIMTSWVNLQGYYTENIIQTWWLGSSDTARENIAKLHPDAVANIQFPKGRLWVAIEYESADKIGSRYERLMRSYYRALDIHLVLYVCETDRLLSKLQDIDRKIYDGEYPKFFYSLKQHILSSDASVFTNRDGKYLRFETK